MRDLNNNAAMQYARDLVLKMHAPCDLGTIRIGSMFEARESCDFLRRVLLSAMLETAAGRIRLVEMAIAGEVESQAVLRGVLIEMKSRHVTLPTELAYYDMMLTKGEIAPLRWRGPKRKDRFLRDISIALLVREVSRTFALPPTGRSMRHPSASRIVAQALGVIGLQMSEAAIVAIWKRYGQINAIT